jgi:quinol-cytochrome oxidoreductase complex cytochrome b subunit
MESAGVVNAGVAGGVALMLILPFLDRGSATGAVSRAIRYSGAFGVAAVGALIAMAYAGTPGVADPGMPGNLPEFGVRISIVVIGLFLLAIGIVLIRISSRSE